MNNMGGSVRNFFEKLAFSGAKVPLGGGTFSMFEIFSNFFVFSNVDTICILNIELVLEISTNITCTSREANSPFEGSGVARILVLGKTI